MSLSYHTLSRASYEDLRYDHIKVSEGEESRPYLDSEDIPTIGIGFNLRDADVRDEVLREFGFDLTNALDSAYRDQIATEVAKSWTNKAALRTALDQIMLARAADPAVPSDDKRSAFEFASVAEMKAVFDIVVEAKEDAVHAWLAGLPESNERAALVSLAYNNPGKLLGPALKAAIEAGDRAEAWYEIRYGSNANDLGGIAKRRYAEADLFDLYEKGFAERSEDQREADFLKIFRMYTKHERSILAYENDPDYAGELANANAEFGADAKPLGGEVADAFNFLADRFLGFDAREGGLAELHNLRSELQALVAAGASSAAALLQLHDGLSGSSEGQPIGIFAAPASHANTIGRYNLPNEEGAHAVDRSRQDLPASNDLIFGDDANNIIKAAGGNDAIVGSPGADTIDGGNGIDTVIYAGSDTGVNVKLNNAGEGQKSSGGDAQGDVLQNVEHVIATASADTLIGNDGDNVLVGLGGDDTLSGGGGDDVLHGGDGADTADYSPEPGAVTIRIAKLGDEPSLTVTGASTGTDTLFSIERIIANDFSGLLEIKTLDPALFDAIEWIDLGKAGSGQGDVVDLSAVGEVGLSIDLTDCGAQAVWLKDDPQCRLNLKNTNVIIGGSGDDTLEGGGKYDNLLTRVDLGGGDDTVKSVARGTIISTGSGRDVCQLGDVVLYDDLSPDDRLVFFEKTLTGAVRTIGSESPYCYNGDLRMGFNKVGELIIEDKTGRETYIADAQCGPDMAAAARTAGLYIFEMMISFYNLIDVDAPSGWLTDTNRILLGDLCKAMTGTSYYEGVDPLVLDLDGDGIELSARSSVSPRFDIDGDGFAEPTGWIASGDGLLARDLNANGRIDDIGELFGSPTTGGFAELATLDDNADGMIDAADMAFADLRVWVDANENARTDPGELLTMAEAGIESIALESHAPGQEIVAGNRIAAEGTFTRADGTTGTVADVRFRFDNFDTVYLGDATVSAEAAVLPNIKGRGTLTDLHVAMTQDLALLQTVAATIPTLTATDLDALREAAMPARASRPAA